jgi:hypothetical protein
MFRTIGCLAPGSENGFQKVHAVVVLLLVFDGSERPLELYFCGRDFVAERTQVSDQFCLLSLVLRFLTSLNVGFEVEITLKFVYFPCFFFPDLLPHNACPFK